MKKKIFLRFLFGIPVGITIGTIIGIVFSVFFGEGFYQPCTPTLLQSFNSQLSAFIFQTILCGIIGGIYSASSVIWKKEEWSLMRQTLAYFLINSCSMILIAYVLGWMDRSFAGFLSYMIIFVIIFVVIWIVFYLSFKISIDKINKKIRDGNKNF